MPKQTFFNLPDEKRQKVIETAIREFAVNNYTNASLSRIVESAGIAKGSMYQYFDSKKDLYFYLAEYISEKKLTFIRSHFDKAHKKNDFFELYKQIIFHAARFDLTYPTYSRLLYNAGHESYHPEIGDMSKKILSDSMAFMEGFIRRAQDENQIRRDLPPSFIAFLVSYLSVDLGDYIEKQFGFNYIDVIKEGQNHLPISNDELNQVLADLCSFLKKGLSI